MNEKTLRVLEYQKIINMLTTKAESSLGKELAINLMPHNDMKEVEKFQLETDEAVRMVVKRGRPPLGGIHDVYKELKRAEIGSALSPRNLLKIAETLRAARKLRNFLLQSKADKDINYPIIEQMIDNLNVFREIEDDIFGAIISEEEISDNASTTLRNIRRQISLKNTNIRSKLNSITSSQAYSKYLQESIVTIRADRFVVPVKQEYRANFPGLVHDQSSSGATLFIEPMAIVELNNQLKELKIQEKKEIERILLELTLIVAEQSFLIRENQKILARIDFVFAKGKLALQMKAVKPKLNDNGYMNIKNGRHPLLEADEVVPNNVYLGKEFKSLVITGPNTGGKTVTLKTMGLLALMTQAGLQIPADYGTEMTVYKKIFADIGDEQSIEQSLSTFSSHMTNIVDILKVVDENSLVLFDELGAGTDPTEGAALAMAILNYLYDKGIKTVATTHYSELKIYALTTEGVENASVEFDVETLSPTYRLSIGVPGKSNAFEISKRLGMKDFVIDSAKELLTKENVEFEDVLQKIEKDRIVVQENKVETERLKIEVESLKKQLAEKKEKLEKNKNQILREAKQEARQILSEAKEESDNIIKELRGLSDEVGKDRNKKIQQSKDKIKTSLDKLQNELTSDVLSKKNTKPPQNLKPGDSVLLLNLNQNGIVMTKPDSSGIVTVQVGIMKVNMNISNLKKIKSEAETKTATKTKKMINIKNKRVNTELDLRGMNLEEAIMDVDKYLDDVYIAGLNKVTIIHGKGTGILREGIGQMLRRHRHVKKYRLGEYREGGTGVTIVELK